MSNVIDKLGQEGKIKYRKEERLSKKVLGGVKSKGGDAVNLKGYKGYK